MKHNKGSKSFQWPTFLRADQIPLTVLEALFLFLLVNGCAKLRSSLCLEVWHLQFVSVYKCFLWLFWLGKHPQLPPPHPTPTLVLTLHVNTVWPCHWLMNGWCSVSLIVSLSISKTPYIVYVVPVLEKLIHVIFNLIAVFFWDVWPDFFFSWSDSVKVSVNGTVHTKEFPEKVI